MAGPQIAPLLTNLLKQYGLDSLTGWAIHAATSGMTEEEFEIHLYRRPEFAARFPAIFARERAGLPPISVDDYLNYERVSRALSSTWAIPLSKADIDGLLENDVSPQELEQRFTIAATAVYESDTETRRALESFFGISVPQLGRYWMDPKAELGKLQQQYRMGEIGGAALRSGYGSISSAQARRLQDVGLDRDTALQGFTQLETMSELFDPFDQGEFEIDQDQQIDLLAGDADVAEMVEQRARRRAAEFEGSGSFAAGEEGFATGQAED